MGSNYSQYSEQDFIFQCKIGNFDMVKKIWLMSNITKSKININTQNDAPFTLSCIFGHLEIAKWLWELSLEVKLPININVNNEHIFIIVCQNGHIEMAKWLWQLSINCGSPINIRAQKDEAFRMSCVCNEKEVVSWLCELVTDYNFIIDSEGFIRPKIYTFFDRMIENKNNKDLLESYVKNWSKIDQNKYCLICHEQHDIIINLNCQKNIDDHCYCIECFCNWYSKKAPKCIVCMRNIGLMTTSNNIA
jgi:hypothetical protein